jgi:uncharacterized membrane protein YphA (DoxX/SURF4 family)
MNNTITNTQKLTNLTAGKNTVLWILQILTAAAFLIAGSAKLFGNPLMIESFEKIGLGQWFRYLTGTIEVVSAVLLMVSRLSPVGALLLICIMLGAIFAHLFVIGGPPIAPIILFLFNVIIFLARIIGRKSSDDGRS